MDPLKFIELKETKDDVLAKLRYLKGGGLDEYVQYSLGVLGLKKLPSRQPDQIIQQILPKSPNELDRKRGDALYYVAHVCCVKSMMEEMLLNDGFLENLDKYQVTPDKDLVVYNYYNLLREVLFDMVLLLQDYKVLVKNEQITPSIGKSPYQSDFTLYQLLPQVIFGQVSFHAFIEREPNVSIALIRQVIELKMRHGFGVLGIYDTVKDSFEPLPLSQLFDEINKHKANITFAIPFENVIRINGWANIFMHTGLKDYTWTLVYVYRYLHEFIKGKEVAGKWSVNSGIRLQQVTLDNIITSLESTIKGYSANLELLRVQPTVEII
jgi:hypothetical protein